MKDRNGNEVEVGDRVLFPYAGIVPDRVGKVMDIVDGVFHIWAVSDTHSLDPWKRRSSEIELMP